MQSIERSALHGNEVMQSRENSGYRVIEQRRSTGSLGYRVIERRRSTGSLGRTAANDNLRASKSRTPWRTGERRFTQKGLLCILKANSLSVLTL